MNRSGFKVVRHPSSRLGTVDLGKIGMLKHHVAALVEVDVTEALELVRTKRAEGVSFFSWAVATIGAVVGENRYVHALRRSKNTTVELEEVDVSIVVERRVEDALVPLPLVIRDANHKSAQEIYAEVQAAQRQEIGDEGGYVLGRGAFPSALMRLYYFLPQSIRLMLMRCVLAAPRRSAGLMGTVMVTSVGGVGRVPAWVIPRSMHNLCFALGPVTKKAWVVEGRIEARDILHLTVLINHDVVDGMPAARFISRLVARMQSPR